MANRNNYSRTKEGRAGIAGIRKKYPWLGADSPILQLMRRKYSHPDEVMLAINSSYDGDIPDSIDGFSAFISDAASPYNAFVNDAWDLLTEHGPMTLENVVSYLPTADFNEGAAERVAAYIEALMSGADSGDNEDSDIIASSYNGPVEYDDKFLAYEDTLTDLFDDARKVAKSRKLSKEAEDSKDTWLDKLYNKRNCTAVDSNGNCSSKGPDGLEGTDDDTDDTGTLPPPKKPDDDSRTVSDATQKNILSALLQHKL